jgi:hypothetical protein
MTRAMQLSLRYGSGAERYSGFAGAAWNSNGGERPDSVSVKSFARNNLSNRVQPI